mmetsp:Transcript_131858/g.299784  ORF Transcript_131858/g.299784 Transcript_131858/m.299784 type:complete len:239 (-) Transcript_131858:161-877(-)
MSQPDTQEVAAQTPPEDPTTSNKRRLAQLHAQFSQANEKSETEYFKLVQTKQQKQLEADRGWYELRRRVAEKHAKDEQQLAESMHKRKEQVLLDVTDADRRFQDFMRKKHDEMDRFHEARTAFNRNLDSNMMGRASRYRKALEQPAKQPAPPKTPRKKPKKGLPQLKTTAPRFILGMCPPPLSLLRERPRTTGVDPRTASPFERKIQKQRFMSDMMAPHNIFFTQCPQIDSKQTVPSP